MSWKVRRDVRITTIYEGTSEIMGRNIARDRWRLHLKSLGRCYTDIAPRTGLRARKPDVGASWYRHLGACKDSRRPEVL